MGAIKREMNNWKWTVFAIGYQCVFAYVIAMIIYQLGSLFTGNVTGAAGVISVIVAFLLLALILYMLFRPYKESSTLKTRVKA